MNKFQERTVYISLGILVLFLAVSLMTNRWGFLLLSLPPIFINVTFAFFAKNNKHIQRFNQRHSEKLKPQ